MRARLLIVTASVISASAAYWPACAHACSCAVGFVSSDPMNGQAGWARNQALQLGGNLQPETIRLQRAGGASHAFTLRQYQQTGACAQGFVVELIPTPALDPDTHYVITFSTGNSQPSPSSGQNTMIEFSTGAELLPDPELQPPTRAQLMLTGLPNNVSTSCGPVAAHGCLVVDDKTDLEIVMRRGDVIINQVKVTENNTPLILWELPTCIDVQRHASTGRRSLPLSFCGDALKSLSPEAVNCPGDIFATQSRGVDTMRPQAVDLTDPLANSARFGSMPPSAAGSGGSGSITSAQSATQPQSMAANSEPTQQVYGCSAMPHGGDTSRTPYAVLACLVLWHAAAGLVALHAP